MKKKIGIFGGSFSPPHNGHIIAAISFYDSIGLDVLYIMPANIAPHKSEGTVDSEKRFEMCKIAFQNLSTEKNIIVSDYEIKKGGISYTSDTLSHFASNDSELFFLCGTDMFLSLNTWHRPDIICSLATIVLMRREKDKSIINKIKYRKTYLKKKYNAKIISIHQEPIEISSTEIRYSIKNKLDCSTYVSNELMSYIIDHNLYV